MMFAATNKMGAQGKVWQLEVSKIRPCPWQPRRSFDEEELRGLAASIRANGIIQPLTIRRSRSGGYQLIAGERRLRAAKQAGLTKVPCIEIQADDEKAAVLSLLENLQRQDLNFFEEAEAIAGLIEEWEISQEAAAARLGKSQSALANKLRLLRLEPLLRERIQRAGLTERHARALLRLPDARQREEALDQIIRRKLKVADAERLIASILSPKEEDKRSFTPIVKDIRLFVNTISHAVDTMRSSGIHAQTKKQETDQYIEVTVRIPKTAVPRSLSAVSHETKQAI